jgi:MYXO-CTERM domain-containing protein
LPRILPALNPRLVAGDLLLITDHVDADSGIRSVAFAQLVHGRRLESSLGLATISFRYKHDRLVAIANESLPMLAPANFGGQLSAKALTALALGHEARLSGDAGPLRVESVADALWWATRRDAKADARLVAPMMVEHVSSAERVRLLIDMRSGELLHRRSDILHGSTPLRYDVPERWPEGGRILLPVADALVSTSGGPDQITGSDGVVEYPGITSNFSHSQAGPYARVNNATGPVETVTGILADGQPFAAGFPNQGLRDAQLSAFVHTNLVKARVRTIAPAFEFLNEELEVNVNLDQTCNAYWDGISINFFVEGNGCANTARLADVVYHEFGHGVHENAIIPGVGAMNIALSEGISDYLAATIVNDSGMARGFFLGSSEPLRELNPVDFEWTWPEDIGEVHDEGRIIGGAFWDLRALLSAKYGPVAGVPITDRLWFEAIRRAVDIPSAYFETLVADDDDGDLTNGTPNVCEINAAFGTHGLFQVPGVAESMKITEGDASMLVSMELEFPYPQCGTSAEIFVSWRDRDAPDDVGSTTMSENGPGQWVAQVPKPEDGTVLQWAVDIAWSVGTEEHHPRNIVDPWYETYVGPVVPLYCTGFEEGLEDWVTSGGWEAGTSSGGVAGGDPASAAEGAWWAGNGLSGQGLYLPGSDAVLSTPSIDTIGFPTVRLQYWRELDVEDGFFDQATIWGDGAPLWTNFASNSDFDATRHHRDGTWRFHDVDLSAHIDDGLVQVAFSLRSDGGLELGGWNLDKLCIVGVEGPACGNGVIDAGETCDDGNLADGDGCSSACQTETMPTDDGGVDESEAGTGFGDPVPQYEVAARGCGCRSEGGPGRGGLLLLVLLGAWRRRDRR